MFVYLTNLMADEKGLWGFSFQLLPGTVVGTAKDAMSLPTGNCTRQYPGHLRGEDGMHKEKK